METATIFDLLAALLEYPGEDYRARAAACAPALERVQPDAATLLAEFSRRIAALSTEELQELYTQTFDLDPANSLDVGWHLFGENYARGEFLVKMRRLLRRFALAESTELPDHLPHALVVLGRMDPQEAGEFAQACVFPALEKMRAGFKDKDNPFENVLTAMARLLESRFACVPLENSPAAPQLRVLNAGGAQ